MQLSKKALISQKTSIKLLDNLYMSHRLLGFFQIFLKSPDFLYCPIVRYTIPKSLKTLSLYFILITIEGRQKNYFNSFYKQERTIFQSFVQDHRTKPEVELSTPGTILSLSVLCLLPRGILLCWFGTSKFTTGNLNEHKFFDLWMKVY